LDEILDAPLATARRVAARLASRSDEGSVMVDPPSDGTTSEPVREAFSRSHVEGLLARQAIETPSWGYGDSGTRFKTFPWPGAARTVWEKIDDAAHVHALTGAAPAVAIHIPWDRVDDYGELAAYAEARGVRIGAVNPNLFQDDAFRLGSLCHPDEAARARALDRMRESCDAMRATGSRDLSVWLADGTNYAGQDDLAARKERLEAGLRATYDMLPEDGRMLIEYKFFEPAFYHTDLADWGAAYAMSLKCGPRAQVLVDTGHHPQGTNIPHIVAFLMSEGRLGGFHFNARKYADDDLIVGTENPFELFDIYVKLVRGGPAHERIGYMIDQSHNIEPKVEAMIQSVVNCQVAYAKALVVDYGALDAAQREGDVLAAHRVLMEAFETDVRPLLRAVREAKGLDPDPIEAHRRSGYAERVAAERGVADAATGGYPAGD
jgi:L-rhamnose isomerase/sugar isomerase